MVREKLNLFSTDIYRFINPAAGADHHQWREAIYQLRSRDPGRSYSNQFGWQSSVPFQAIPQLFGLGRFIIECLEEVGRAETWRMDKYGFVIDAWININAKGASNSFHSHPNAFLSGSYYLDVPPGCGDILFRDPCEAAYVYQPPYASGVYRSPVKAITPVPGMLLVFPAWLLHAVDPNLGDADRISIAFNASLAARPNGPI